MSAAGEEVVIVDYGMGNLRSVSRAFERIGARPRVTDAAGDLRAARRVVTGTG